MSDLFSTAAEWIADVMADSGMSGTVTYARGEDTVDVAATKGETLFEIDTGGAAIQTYHALDFIVRTSELVFDGEAVTPESGDTITETDGDVTRTFRVSVPGSEQCFRYTDPHRKGIRIHTKEIASEQQS